MELIDNFSQFELSPTLAANEKAQALRQKGQKILHMGFGQSPFPVPERLKKALEENVVEKSYLPTAGLDELREVVLSYYQKQIGFDADKYDVLVAPGSKLILYALQMAIKGDLLLPIPSWVSYAPQSKMLERDVIGVPSELKPEGYRLAPEILREAIKSARAEGKNPSKIILNYPSNPTGLSYTADNLKEIAEICREENILIISDEIYGLVAFNGQYRSISAYAPEITAVSTGLSKHLSLGGWRIGVGLIPKNVSGLFKMLNNIASETWSCVPSPIQYACIEAYKNHEDIEAHIRDCTAIHGAMNNYIADQMQSVGIDVQSPQGAFYTYPNFAPFTQELARSSVHDSQSLADSLLEKQGILTLPGYAFGEDAHTLTLRVSGCDYDGAAVLAAYQVSASLDEAFIQKHAPNIIESGEGFKAFIQSL